MNKRTKEKRLLLEMLWVFPLLTIFFGVSVDVFSSFALVIA